MTISVKHACVVLVLALSGCAAFNRTLEQPPQIYVLRAAPSDTQAKPGENHLSVLVSAPKAWPGYDRARIAYVRHPLQVDYYAESEWADQPARMLEPLLMAALQESNLFNAVVSATSGTIAELRIDTEIVQIHHEFLISPSRGRVAIRAQLIDLTRNRVLGTRVFSATESAPTENARGGVTAINNALQVILGAIVDFCRDTLRKPGFRDLSS
ncbi:MAG: ABC-type transport auxiliary lipoprotein family protein [Gammaproteobacteria bacterium]